MVYFVARSFVCTLLIPFVASNKTFSPSRKKTRMSTRANDRQWQRQRRPMERITSSYCRLCFLYLPIFCSHSFTPTLQLFFLIFPVCPLPRPSPAAYLLLHSHKRILSSSLVDVSSDRHMSAIFESNQNKAFDSSAAAFEPATPEHTHTKNIKENHCQYGIVSLMQYTRFGITNPLRVLVRIHPSTQCSMVVEAKRNPFIACNTSERERNKRRRKKTRQPFSLPKQQTRLSQIKSAHIKIRYQIKRLL